MATTTANLYEIMFLVGQATAANLTGVLEHINTLLERAGAETIAMQKWDERRLAYEIEKQKRGMFILTYAKLAPEAVAGLERDCNLSEQIMRVLILRADHLTEEEAAAFDRRDDLVAEAKMRAEAGEAESEQARAMATLGAPPQEEDATEDLDSTGDDEDLDEE
ncbi:MAG: 30S ribosomal protein S6 [Planctomycetota bacterium]|nr:MAG: 30S ribosomal protein S6 [Planctomycetota bacterium]